MPSSRRGALDFALGKQGLENCRRGQAWRRAGDSGKRHKSLCDGTDTVHQSQGLHYVRDLAVDGRIEDAVAGADHRLVILEWIPGKRDARGDVVLVCRESSVLGVEFVTHTYIQGEIGRHGPLILNEGGGKGTGIVVNGIAKTLLIELRQAERSGLDRVNGGRRGSQAAGCRHLETRAQDSAGQIAEHEASGEEGVRLRVVPAVELIAAELYVVLAAHQGHVIGKLIAPHDGEAGEEDLRP